MVHSKVSNRNNFLLTRYNELQNFHLKMQKKNIHVTTKNHHFLYHNFNFCNTTPCSFIIKNFFWKYYKLTTKAEKEGVHLVHSGNRTDTKRQLFN